MDGTDARARLAGLGALGVLALAAVVPSTRMPLLGVLGVGLVVSVRRSWLRWPIAAALPVALNLAWGTLPGGTARPGLLDCVDPISPPATWRLGEALVVVGTVLLLARWLGASREGLGLRRPSRRVGGLAIMALLVLPLVSLAVGPVLARPFFGDLDLHTGDPAAIVPAIVLAISNGSMEEIIYRGSLMAWLTPVVGARTGLIGQAVIFGLAHVGSDYTGSPIPVLLLVATGGLIAGLIVRRTGSLALPILVHAAVDVPLYYAAACRLS